MAIEIKRVYNEAHESDGFRILVDRLWPRGLNKERANVDLWLKDIAPSEELRKWFSHDPAKGDEFKQRYFQGLDHKKELVSIVIQKAREGKVTLLYGAKEEKFNNGMALKEYIEAKMR
mgnify:FL=1